jgi:hypothetical protein
MEWVGHVIRIGKERKRENMNVYRDFGEKATEKTTRISL